MNNLENYYVSGLGTAWVVRDSINGEVVSIRPDEDSALEVAINLEGKGQYGEQRNEAKSTSA